MRVAKHRSSPGSVDGGRPAPPCAGGPNGVVETPTPSWVVSTRAPSGAGWRAASDAAFASVYPVLADYLTLTGMNGKDRKTATMLVFCEDGRWKACLNDRETCYYAFVSADSFTGLLEAVETGLKSGGHDWRQSKARR